MKEFNTIILGIFLGLLSIVLALAIYYLAKFTAFSIGDFLYYVVNQKKTFIPVILAAGGNLWMFYAFLNRNKYQSAKGVLISTALLIVALILIKFVV